MFLLFPENYQVNNLSWCSTSVTFSLIPFSWQGGDLQVVSAACCPLCWVASVCLFRCRQNVAAGILFSFISLPSLLTSGFHSLRTWGTLIVVCYLSRRQISETSSSLAQAETANPAVKFCNYYWTETSLKSNLIRTASETGVSRRVVYTWKQDWMHILRKKNVIKKRCWKGNLKLKISCSRNPT